MPLILLEDVFPEIMAFSNWFRFIKSEQMYEAVLLKPLLFNPKFFSRNFNNLNDLFTFFET